jgi:FAD/FMN-containing dehydrogenase
MLNRRQFCKTSVYAGIAASLPLGLVAGTQADISIPAVTLEGGSTELKGAQIRELAQAMKGAVVLSEDPGYDQMRKVWNGMHDKHPALIARCANATDARHAVEFARDNNLLTAIRGGGHSWPGKSVCDGGIMIDLADMTRVEVDTSARTATAGGGALLGHLDTATLQKGLVTTAGVVSHTGVGGFTLGGGFGRLNRKYGLAIDNLVAAEIITADGTLRTVSAEQEPDLFWAIRGGGGNFGVATSFTFRVHPFDRNVLSGMIMWPIAQARDVLDFYGEWYAGLSRELYVGPIMVTTPEGDSVIGMEVVYNGDPAQGEKEVAPLRSIGKPMNDGIKLQDYTVMQTQEDATFAHGIRSYIKNGMVKEVTPGLVETMIDAFVADPRMAMFTHTAGGAVKQVGELDTAFPHRNAETMVLVGGGWMDPEMDEECMAIGRSWFKAFEPFVGGYYDNIQSDTDDKASETYGPAYRRLAQVKGQYDPGNLFRLNRNIRPA